MPFDDSLMPSWNEPYAAQSISDDPCGTGGISPAGVIGTGPAGSSRLVAWEVGWDQGTNWLGFQGGRESCANSANFTLKIKKHVRMWPDRVISSTSGRGNQILRTYGACDGRKTYYGEVVSTTGTSIQGERRELC